jgi:hypothetical protein
MRAVKNLLLEPVEYKTETTSWGVWRSFLGPDGNLFQEFVSHYRLFGLPLVHYTHGRCPETGRRITAKGIIAIGRVSMGVLAIGQAAVGIVAIGQLAIGLLLGLGQASTGVLALGQLALAAGFGLGQFVTGYVAIGQFGYGRYVLAQMGLGMDVWDMRGTAPAAREFFRWLVP